MYEALVVRVRYHIQKANFMGLKEAESTLLLAEAADAIEQLTADLERSKEWEDFWKEQAEEAKGKLQQYALAVANKPRWISVTERLAEPKQTKADRLRAMNDEELANFILHHDVCPGFVTDTFSDANRKKYGFDGRSERCEWKDECHECWLDWLREEVE